MASRQLKIFTVVQDMINYCITITAKSPKRYRGNISDRLINSAFDMLEYVTRANAINFSIKEMAVQMYTKRRELQYEAIASVRMVEQVALVSKMNDAITMHQYETLALKMVECSGLCIAWAKADKKRFDDQIAKWELEAPKELK